MEILSVRLESKELEDYERVLNLRKSAIIRELVKEGKKHKAVYLYKDKKVSLGLGARLAGVSLSEFIDMLKDHNVSLNIEKEDVEEALMTARKVL